MVYFIDMRTKDGKRRMTSFSEDPNELVQHFAEWVVEDKVKPEELWFARIFECDGPRHVANLRLKDGGIIEKEPAPEGSRLTLRDSRYTLLVKIKYRLGLL